MSQTPPRSLFPDPHTAPADAPMAMGGRLNVDMLREAYRCGIFPWYSSGQPILWWSPDPRFVLRPLEARISRSLRKEARKRCWSVTFDRAFSEVIRGCAESVRPGQEGTWITDDMIAGYEALHQEGLAHSVECWRDGQLAGGLYGVSIGAMFAGESMFYRRPDASKVAFIHLIAHLAERNFAFIDCQQRTEHLARFGAKSWSRKKFLAELAQAVAHPNRF